MDTVLIATTRQEGLHAIGTGGQPVIQAYDQLARYLGRAFSEAHAGLLAEPNYNPSRGTVDWYAPAQGPVVPLAEADPVLRRTVEGTLVRLRDDIRQRAGTLAKSADGGDRLLGQMLELALEVPGEDYIYCAGEQPVLVCWGMLEDTPQPERGVLRKFVPYTPPPPPPEPPPPSVGAVPAGGAAVAAMPAQVALMERPLWWLAWLLWLVFALLVAGIFIVLLSGCGFGLPGSAWLADRGIVNLCPAPAVAADPREAPELRAELARERVLHDRIRDLQRRVALERRRCAAARETAPAAPGAPPPATPGEATPDEAAPETDSGGEDQSFDPRLEREGAATGEVAVSLAWEGHDDLDLHVRCPDSSVISYRNRQACGGALDVDMNAGGRVSDEPVENVSWPAGAAAPGRYAVIVDKFRSEPGQPDPTPFRVRIRTPAGTEVVEGVIREADTPQVVYEFEVP